MEKKMTYVVALDNAISVVENEEVKARLLDLKASLQKKATNKKPTKVQVENEKLKETLYTVLVEQGKPMTVSEVIKADASLAGLSTQKVTPLLTQMISAEKVAKKVDKKSTLYYAV